MTIVQTSPACQSVLLSEYIAGAQATDRFPETEVQPILLGLFGELAAVMAAVKKHKRERDAFVGFAKPLKRNSVMRFGI